MDDAANFVLSCMNFDGGFGVVPGSESHAGQIYCCVGALAIAGKSARRSHGAGFRRTPRSLPFWGADLYCVWFGALMNLFWAEQLHRVDVDLLGWWLAERQLPAGGFNGRPEKVHPTPFPLHNLARSRLLAASRFHSDRH